MMNMAGSKCMEMCFDQHQMPCCSQHLLEQDTILPQFRYLSSCSLSLGSCTQSEFKCFNLLKLLFCQISLPQ